MASLFLPVSPARTAEKTLLILSRRWKNAVDFSVISRIPFAKASEEFPDPFFWYQSSRFFPDIQKSATVTAAFRQNQDTKDKLDKEENFVTNIEKKFEEVKAKATQSPEGSYQENKEKVQKSLQEMDDDSKIVEKGTKLTFPARSKSLNAAGQKLFEDAKNAFLKAKEQADWIKGLGLKADAQDTSEKTAAGKFNELVGKLNKEIKTVFSKAKVSSPPNIDVPGNSTMDTEGEKSPDKSNKNKRRSSNKRSK